jgi:hypothetical protein
MLATMSDDKYSISRASVKTTDGLVAADAGSEVDLTTDNEAEAIAEFDQRPGTGWTLWRVTSNKPGQSEIVRRK